MDQTTVLLSRYLGVAFGAALSYQMIDLVYSERLKYYLADQKFEFLVIFGGVLLALVVLLRLRGLAVKSPAGDHHHHDHGHDHHDHGHVHGAEDPPHSHNPSLWRYIVIAFPVMVLLLGMAPTSLSDEALLRRSSKDLLEAIGKVNLPEGRKVAGEPVLVNWKELDAARFDDRTREYWQKLERPVSISGQFMPTKEFNDRYRLMRQKITCCAGDATTLSVTVMDNVSGWQSGSLPSGQWVEVIGAVDFFGAPDKDTGRTNYYPVVHALAVEKTQEKPWVQ